MARDRLAPFTGRRIALEGTFVRYSLSKRGDGVATALFIDIRDVRGEALCDHLWIDDATLFWGSNLQVGDRVAFSVWVFVFVSGYYPHDFHERVSKAYKVGSPRSIYVLKRLDEDLGE